MRRRKTVICREGWYYLVVLAFVAFSSVLRNVNLLMFVATIMLFVLLFSWRIAVRALSGVTLRRKMPPSVTVGDPLEVQIELQSTASKGIFKRAASRCLQIDETIRHLLPKSQLAKKTVHLLCWYLPRGSSQTITYRARLFQRGIYRVGPTRIATGFPLGLVRHSHIRDRGDRIVVFPRTGHLTPAYEKMFRQIQVGMRGNPLRQDRQTGDFHGLREWKEGDGRRMIHWRSTARRGVPVVREFEQQQQQELNLLLDLGGLEDDVDEQRCEEAIRFAATIVTDFCLRRDGLLRLAIVGRKVTFGGGMMHPHLLDELLTLLATAETNRRDSSTLFAEGLHKLCRPDERARPTLILSPRVRKPVEVAVLLDGTAGRDRTAGPIHCIDTSSAMLWHFFDPTE